MQPDLLREVATRRGAGLNSDLHVHEPKATSKRSTFVANYTLDRTGWPASCARSSIEVESVTGARTRERTGRQTLLSCQGAKGVRLQIRTI